MIISLQKDPLFCSNEGMRDNPGDWQCKSSDCNNCSDDLATSQVCKFDKNEGRKVCMDYSYEVRLAIIKINPNGKTRQLT